MKHVKEMKKKNLNGSIVHITSLILIVLILNITFFLLLKREIDNPYFIKSNSYTLFNKFGKSGSLFSSFYKTDFISMKLLNYNSIFKQLYLEGYYGSFFIKTNNYKNKNHFRKTKIMGTSSSMSLKYKTPCKVKYCSAVATPYHLIPGGGEKYLLSIVRAMQKMGEFVDIYVLSKNACRDNICAEATAKAINVDIDWTRANVIQVGINRTHFLIKNNPYYRLFALLGNSAIPMRMAIGELNFFMNQFPFDGGKKYSGNDLLLLASYDFIILNSYYTKYWYDYFIKQAKKKLKKKNIIAPISTVVYPPVTLFNSTLSSLDIYEKNNNFLKTKKPWIVLIGRFFDDVQGKRHLLAIKIFQYMISSGKLDKSARLYLMGYQMPKYEKYTQKIKLEASKIPGVFVRVNIKFENMKEILSKSIIIWSLTGGFDFSTEHHPADSEHFGIAVVEAMSLGCIPVFINRGGLTEIVQNDPLHLCNSISDCANKSLNIINSNSLKLEKLRKYWMKRPYVFNDDVFDQRIHDIFSMKHLSHLNNIIKNKFPKYSIYLPQKSKYAAIIVETRVSIMLPKIIIHTLGMLGKNWKLFIYHGIDNENYIKESLSSFVGIIYNNIGINRLNDSTYNTLLKSSQFWNNLDNHGIEKVLVFQMDAVILNNDISKFLNWDYIGAPWSQENDVYVGINEEKNIIPKLSKEYRVGNGGLSLRSVNAMKIISQKNLSTTSAEQEDVFFVRNLHQLGYAVADINIAVEFAVEVPLPEHVNVNNLFAVHQGWKFMNVNKFIKLTKNSMKYSYWWNKKEIF